MPDMTWSEWLRRLRHDLVKRLVWPARDRRELGGSPRAGELCPELVDDEGNPTTATALWAELKAAAPNPGRRALADFETALRDALAAAKRDDVGGVLALDAAFDRLTHVLAREAP
jgi:hypothetical protein